MSKTAAARSAHGRCHCGRVQFVARFPSRFCAHCHCESCRRAHGAAFDEPVDRAPSGHAFAAEYVAWLPFEVPAP